MQANRSLFSPNQSALDKNGQAVLNVAPHRLPTNTTTRNHLIHRWFNFIAGFSPEFVSQCCINAHLTSGDHLLDPFSGCATAPLVACQLGMRATGYEAHPIFARIGNAKLPVPTAAQEITKISEAILGGLAAPVDIKVLPQAPLRFLSKLFDDKVLGELLGARQSLVEQNFINNDLAFLLLSRIVDKSSHSQTDGIYKAPTSRKIAHRPSEVCRETVQMIHDDLRALSYPNFAALSKVYAHSSESMPEVESGSVSIIVTSPPYLNNFDYAEMTRMLLYFWGIAETWGEITDRVRKYLIVNTTTALRGHKEKQLEYRSTLPSKVINELDSLVAELKSRRMNRAGIKEYDYLVYPYFAQMTAVLNECRRCLMPGRQIHIIVADAALYGIHISAPQILAKIMSAIGFKRVECKQIRKRGHRWVLSKREGSSKGLGEYHVFAHK